MLLAIREKVQGWVAWAIVLVLIVPFALWGIDQYATGDRTVIVAEVNGDPITGQAFLQLYNSQRMRLRQQFGDMYDQVVEDETLREQVLESLIESRLVQQWAAQHGMLISDQQLAAVIESADVFYENGRFSQALYQDILSRNALTVAQFETEQRQFLLENQYNLLSAGTGFVMPNELEWLFALQNQRRNLDYIRVDQRVFVDRVEISEEDKRAFYQHNIDDFIDPESITLEYLVFSQENIAQNLSIEEEEVRQFYDMNPGFFILPELRRARHILIRDADLEKAYEKIAEIEQKIAAGEDFAKLAETYSQDPGSAINGGDLDYFEQGMMVPEFDAVVFEMAVGEVSQAVETDFGVHLIKLESIQQASTQPFDEVKDEVRAQMRLEMAEAEYYQLLEAVNTLAFEQPDSLEPLLAIMDADIKVSAPMTREGFVEGVLSSARIVETAFSDDVLKSRLNSQAVEVGGNIAVVLRVKDYQPEFQKDFAEVEEDITRSLTRQATIAKSAALAEELLAQLEQGVEAESLITEGVEWHPVGWIERQGAQVLPDISQAAFRAPKPVDDQPVWTQAQLFSGDTVLIRINKVDVVENEETRVLMPQFEDALAEIFAEAEIKARIERLKQDARISKRTNHLSL